MVMGVVLFGAISEFLLPITYTITEQGASASSLFARRSIRWKDVRHVYLDSLGVKLSPVSRESRLEAFRGVYLRFDRNQDKVLAAVLGAVPR